MNRQAAEQLAAWLAKNQPRLFDALARQAAAKSAHTVGGFLDVFKTVGTALGTGVKAVGSFLTTGGGLQAISELGSAYLTTQSQRSALDLQVAQMRAANAPFPISTNEVGGAVYTAANGSTYPLTPQLAAQLRGSTGMSQYLPWILLAGGAVVVLLLLTKR